MALLIQRTRYKNSGEKKLILQDHHFRIPVKQNDRFFTVIQY